MVKHTCLQWSMFTHVWIHCTRLGKPAGKCGVLCNQPRVLAITAMTIMA